MDESAPAAATPAAGRAEIEAVLTAFRQWLLESEQWRDGLDDACDAVPAEPEVDLHTVVREWTALRQEVRLDARGGKAMREELERAVSGFTTGVEQVHQGVEKMLEPLVRERDRFRDELTARLDAQQTAWIDLLLDVREGIERGAVAAQGVRQSLGWRRWFVRQAKLDGVVDGYQLALRRIDAALDSRGVRPIECQGRPVDPERMRVIEVVQRDDVPEGHVADVIRRGYALNGRVLRFAEVRAVGRRDAKKDQEDQHAA